VGEHEIGSETWMRERIERGLDPGEGDRPEYERFGIQFAGLAGQPKEAYPAWDAPDVPTSFTF
jgi:hypothetical protein